MTPSATSLQIKKFIKAKRERVFQAWTDPALMKLWYAPGSMSVVEASSDPRVGGRYSIHMRGQVDAKQGACESSASHCSETEPHMEGSYQKVVANELLVFSWNRAGAPAPASVVTVEFKDVPGGTEVVLTHERLADAASRDRHLQGWTGCLENLADRIGVSTPSVAEARV